MMAKTFDLYSSSGTLYLFIRARAIYDWQAADAATPPLNMLSVPYYLGAFVLRHTIHRAEADIEASQENRFRASNAHRQWLWMGSVQDLTDEVARYAGEHQGHGRQKRAQSLAREVNRLKFMLTSHTKKLTSIEQMNTNLNGKLGAIELSLHQLAHPHGHWEAEKRTDANADKKGRSGKRMEPRGADRGAARHVDARPNGDGARPNGEGSFSNELLKPLQPLTEPLQQQLQQQEEEPGPEHHQEKPDCALAERLGQARERNMQWVKGDNRVQHQEKPSPPQHLRTARRCAPQKGDGTTSGLGSAERGPYLRVEKERQDAMAARVQAAAASTVITVGGPASSCGGLQLRPQAQRQADLAAQVEAAAAATAAAAAAGQDRSRTVSRPAAAESGRYRPGDVVDVAASPAEQFLNFFQKPLQSLTPLGGVSCRRVPRPPAAANI